MSTSTRTILITGCASGIGRAAAQHFAAAGDTVVATVRTLARATQLRSALENQPTSEILELDVTSEAATGVVQDVITRHGGIDVLINNAGLAVEGTLEDLSMDQLRQSFEVNFFVTARMTKAVLPSMRMARSGRIIAVSSISGAMGMAFQEPYASAKFALEGLFESTAPVAAMFGVHMTLLQPGPVSGEFVTKPTAVVAPPSEPYKEMYEAFTSMRNQAYQSCPTPQDLAAILLDLSRMEDPPLRMQDTDATRKMVGRKLADIDGSGVMASRAILPAPAATPPTP